MGCQLCYTGGEGVQPGEEPIVFLKAPSVDDIVRTNRGSLSHIPFAHLLFALSSQEKSLTLELRRAQLRKVLVFEDGVPVHCESNILQESLGRFLVERHLLAEEDHQRILSLSAQTGEGFGELLLKHNLVTPFDLFRQLQQNLAHKLLDCFSWTEGEFLVLPTAREVESPMKVNVPQMIFTGITRSMPYQDLEHRLTELINTPLSPNPSPPLDLESLKLNTGQAAMLSLARRPGGISLAELATQARCEVETVSRFVYALVLMQVLTPAASLPREQPKPAPMPEVRLDTPAASPPEPTPTPPPAHQITQDAQAHAPTPQEAEDITRLFLTHRLKDPFDLLEVDEKASMAQIKSRFLAFCRRHAPWRFDDELQDKAAELFFAGAVAFGRLMDVESRAGVLRQRQERQQQKQDSTRERFAIKTDLLDAAAQYRKGQALMNQGHVSRAYQVLSYALELEPQNTRYRATAAYCHYLMDHGCLDKTEAELRECLTLSPQCGITCYYLGMVLKDKDNLKDAEVCLRRALKLLGSDRRPLEALRELTLKKK